MLQSLNIRNLATVDQLEVDFNHGLNVLTGETGAGKSVILGAVELLLGSRGDKSVIRHGADFCEVTGIFELGSCSYLDKAINDLLDQSGVSTCEDGQLLVKRVLKSSGSRSYINSSPATLKVIKALGNLLVDIHGPNDHQSLLNTNCQRDLLDTYGKHEDLRSRCRDLTTQIKEQEKKLEELRNQNISPAEAELLEHQVKEIEDAELQEGEEEQLTEKHRVASHSRRLLEIADNCRHGLVEADGSINDQTAEYVRMLSEAAEIHPAEAQPLMERMENVVEEVQEISRDLSAFAENLDLNEEELQQVEERLDLIHKLKRKHNATITQLNEKAQEIRERLNRLNSQEDLIKETQKKIESLQKQLQKTCDDLSEKRQNAAQELAKAISEKLSSLGFAQADFEISTTSKEPGADGADIVEFRFAPNPGESMQPLRKIASSGEIARVMLAVKTVLSAADQVPVLIFDEVDANIGGRVARQVAEQLCGLGETHQVLCITHLPQIAAGASEHFEVGKRIENDRTITTINKLDTDQRVNEISRMMGADESSASAQNHAREMLEKQA